MLEILFIAFIIFTLIASILGIMEIKVKKISTIYNSILEINKTTYFHNLAPYYPINAVLNSKKEFDNCDFDSIMHDTLKQENTLSMIEMYINETNENKVAWAEYKDEIYGLDLTTSNKDVNNTFIPKFIYIKLETKLIKEITRNKPVIDPLFKIKKTYTSPKGRNYYRDDKSYSLSTLNYHRKYVKEKEEIEVEYRKSAAYQRKLMTPSLRYDILKRDGFKCQICGYSQEDGVKLHVDHILPVAKGGKTKKGNLRTLCEDCNLGKSHKYDPQGTN